MKTVTIQIGNSDDKLNQKRWALFIKNIMSVAGACGHIHFSGCSNPEADWQNFCVVIAVNDDREISWIREHLKPLCGRFEQDSIAMTIGETEMVSNG